PAISNHVYEGDFAEAFLNPERGWNKRTQVTKARDFSAFKAAGITVLHSYIEIYDYLGLSADKPWSDDITAKLPDALLEDLQEGLNAVREAGMKIILNPGYAWSWTPPIVENWDIIKEHIRQINEVIGKNADVVLAFEAGIIGRWGEWNITDDNADIYATNAYIYEMKSKEGAAFRYELIKLILETLPDSVLVSVRYPVFIMEAKYMASSPPEGMEALSAEQIDRLGFHNNSFMVEPGDWGSYSTYGQSVWWAKESGWAKSNVPTNDEIRGWIYDWRTLAGGNMMMGGEVEWSEATDWGFEGTLLYEQSVPPLKVLSDLAELHTTHMSTDYNGIHIDLWRETMLPSSEIGEPEESVYERMGRKMGYRLRFTEAQFTTAEVAGGEFTIKANIHNDGYAGIVKARPTFIVLDDGQNRYDIYLNELDVRLWMAGEHTLEASFALPENMPKGAYTVALWLPDISENLRTVPEYSVRFANKNMWDAQKGYNKLGELIVFG
ncbi:MAG: DUF4832 domain-containing protein, partial [Oscillospiraceae bacterium]|nr:DUF4832 domain-containing protein [Oscillospiraceae bacterium]